MGDLVQISWHALRLYSYSCLFVCIIIFLILCYRVMVKSSCILIDVKFFADQFAVV